MKTQNLFIMTALMTGLMACGGNDDSGVNPYPYQPGDHYNIPNTPNSGSFGNTEEWMISQLQHHYGNIKINTSVNLGNNTLSSGKHSWKAVLNRIKQSAEHFTNCRINNGHFNQHQYLSTLARTDMSCLRSSIVNMAGQNLQNIAVRYDRDPGYNYNMLHTVDQILTILSSSYSQMFNSWYGYGYYPVSYYPVWPQSNNGAFLGVNYNSGSGLSIGGGINWNF